MKNQIKYLLIILLSTSFFVSAENQRTMVVKAMNVDQIDLAKKELTLNGEVMRMVEKDQAYRAELFTDVARVVELENVELDKQYYFLLIKEESAFTKGRNKFKDIVAIYNSNPRDKR